MTTGWSYKLKLLLFLPLVGLFTMGDRCGGGGEPPDETPPDGRSVFFPEYDYMEDYDVFQYGEKYAIDAFDPCNTDFDAFDDDIITPAVEIDFYHLFDYMKDHAQRYDDSTFVYKVQLLGMGDALNKPGEGAFEIVGITFYDTTDHRRSAIFVQAIIDMGGDVQSMLEKSVIHELGHARGKLTHLCYFDTIDSTWYQSPDHNDPACVMGQGRIAPCTGHDLTVDPHFCPACCNRLKRVKW